MCGVRNIANPSYSMNVLERERDFRELIAESSRIRCPRTNDALGILGNLKSWKTGRKTDSIPLVAISLLLTQATSIIEGWKHIPPPFPNYCFLYREITSRCQIWKNFHRGAYYTRKNGPFRFIDHTALTLLETSAPSLRFS